MRPAYLTTPFIAIITHFTMFVIIIITVTITATIIIITIIIITIIINQAMGLPEQVNLPQGCHELHRPAGHPTLLRVTHAARIQQKHRTVPKRTQGRSNIQGHEDHAHSQTGQTLHRTSVARLHAATELQGTRSTDDVPCHRHPRLLQSRLFRREGRKEHRLPLDTGDFLVGSHHHDDRGLWGHVPDDPVG